MICGIKRVGFSGKPNFPDNVRIGKFFIPNILYIDDNPRLIEGVELRKLPIHSDDRGYLIELVKEQSTETMCYISRTNVGMARDEKMWHRHKLQTDRFSFLAGSCIFAISDGVTTQKIYITCEDNIQLIIPPLVYHAFLSCSQGFTLINNPTKLYNPLDELRISFLDILADPPWQIQST